MRIVSLLPSATETICALGLADQLVGVTHECDWPPEVAALPKVTRTHIPTDAASAEIDRLVRSQLEERGALYSLDTPALAALRPDLIVTQTLCEVCAVADSEVRAAVRGLDPAPRVLHLEPTRLDDVLADVEKVAVAAGTGPRGRQVVLALRQRIERVRAAAREALQAAADAAGDHGAVLAIRHDRPPPGRPVGLLDRQRPRVVVLEWLAPPFSSGHWTPELVQIAGANEVLADPGQRSRQITLEEVAAAEPQVILVACCGFSVDRTLQDLPAFLADPRVRDLPAVRERRVFVVDGSAYFSRPGPRLIDSLEILAHALWPNHCELSPGVPPATRAPRA